MYKTIFLLTVLVSLFSTQCFAQQDGYKRDSSSKKAVDPEYTYVQRTPGAGNELDMEKPQANVVKMGLTRWLSGVIPFYYERKLAPFVSLQFGLGLTTRDFIYDAISDLAEVFSDNGGPDYNNYAFYKNAGRKASVGVYASFQPKFYPQRKGIARFFVSPMVEFKRFDYKAQYANPFSSSYDEPTYQSNYMWENRQCVDFTVNVGRQWFTHTGVAIELYGGVGFQKNWEFRRYLTNGGSSGYFYNSTTSFSYYRPEFNLDLNIGGCF